jgi:endonuclease G
MSNGVIFAFDTEAARAAAARWKDERVARDRKIKAVDEGHVERAETRERLAKRINYLVRKVKSTRFGDKTPMQERLEMIVAGDAVPEEAADAALLERVIGETQDFLSIEFLSGGLAASEGVARLVTRLGGGRVQYGSGFLVSRQLLLTNHHVLKDATVAARTEAEFDYQLSVDGLPMVPRRFALRPDRFFLNDRDHDMALVAVDPIAADGTALDGYRFSPLIATEGKILIGDPINIIQHPQGRMKQVVVRENRLLDLPPADGGRYAHYEADTEPGSSGSPVFNDQWEVIALHHSGVPKTDSRGNILNTDGERWQAGQEIDWIGNEGIRVSRLIAFITAVAPSGTEPALKDVLLRAAADMKPRQPAPRPEPDERRVREPLPPVADPADRAAGQRLHAATSAPTSVAAGQDTTMRITVPLTITLSFGVPEAPVAAPPVADRGDATEAERARRGGPAPFTVPRPGYDPRFLGDDAPLPQPTRAIADDVLRTADGECVLPYFHYSVIMSRRRMIAYVSAVNIDADAPVQYERKGKDAWYYDPRIGEDQQADNTFYADNPLDRGHLTRRADAAWGRTEEEARLANVDTFHWTNCAPQHEVFNQSTRADQRGLLLWGNLENHVMTQAKAGLKQVSVFNGPIFRNSDRSHRGLMIPREYWKVIIYRANAGDLSAAAFVLSQASLIRNLPEEDFVIGPYRPFQVTLAALALKTRLDFGALAGVDPLARPGAEEALEAGTGILPIDAPEQVIL